MKSSTKKYVKEIVARAGREGVDSLSASDRLIAVAWDGTATIGNGGFYKFYDEGCDIHELEAAYRTLGLTACAEACRRSREQFPGGRPPRNEEDRERLLRPRYEELEEAFWQIADPIFDVGVTKDGLYDAIERHLKLDVSDA